MQTFIGNIVTEFRRFYPQVAYVALVLATIINQDLQSHTTILAGLSLWALLVAAVQAVAVVAPRSVVVKVVASLVTALAQVAVAALTDNRITGTEWVAIAVAFFTWAASASHVNIPTGAYLVAKVPYGATISVGNPR